MKSQPTTFESGAVSRFLRATFIAGLLPALVLLLSVQSSHAGSATWLASPATGDWNTAANWTAGGPPNGSADSATFDTSNMTGISLSANAEVNGIVFNAGASAFIITASPMFTLTISGVGVTNNSGLPQNFATTEEGEIWFENSATAGSLTIFTNTAALYNYGITAFFGNSTAGTGTFTNDGGTVSGGTGGSTAFFSTSTAGNSTIINNGGMVSGARGGNTIFYDPSSMGNATLIANGSLNGGNGGAIYPSSGATTARVEVFGNGYLSAISGNVTIGSIEGNGAVFLGAYNLTVGTNNLSTAFSGIISDLGEASSLTKTGNGKLTLSGANTYTGATTVSRGTLLVTNRIGSATGTGAVAVNAGTFGGTGRISGAVTIGTATSAAILAPGSGAKPGKLTLSKTLSFNARANYKVDLNSTLVTADQVVAKGVTINSGAIVTTGDLGAGTLTAGTVFTIINNTAATPIAGTFSNLADGSTLIVGSNTYKTNYEGGTGNDLTLTVQ